MCFIPNSGIPIFAGVVASQAVQGVTGWYTPTETLTDRISTSQDGVFPPIEGSFTHFKLQDYQARAVKNASQTWAVEKEA